MEFDDLIKEIKKYNEKANFDLIKEGYEFSKKAHERQKRASGEEFIQHPLNVAKILAELKLDEEIIIAALLHDVVEDTDTGYKEIEERFGKNVGLIVRGVTKINRLKAKTAKDYKAEVVRKMLIASAKDIRVIILKLADKLHNMRTLEYLDVEDRKRIAKEAMEIYAPIAYRIGLATIKWELEDRAFHYLEPEIYDEFKLGVAKKRKQREKEIRKVISILNKELRKNEIKAEITGRPKHFYSIYQKMKAKNKDFDEIYDLVGIRIITESKEDCYKVLGIVHNLWKPIPKEFDDYIANPKENMYQSLHTVMIGAEEQRIEIQIRTREMHNIAEEGIAAHWGYKGFKGDRFDKRLSWLRQILDWRREAKVDVIKAMRVNFFEDSIFTFTPKGEIIELPRGSTPVDFAYAVHSDLGDRCNGARINEKFVSLRHELKDGDVVEILTSKQHTPSRDWLKFVKSSKAKEKIKRAIKLKQGIAINAPIEIIKKDVNESLFKAEGIRDENIKIAKCCDVMPGDKIAGIKSDSGKVNVHLVSCKSLMDSKKVIDVEWKDYFKGVVNIRVNAIDRVGLLADILNTVAITRTNVREAKVTTTSRGYADNTFTIDFNSLESLKDLIIRIRKIADVKRVRIE